MQDANTRVRVPVIMGSSVTRRAAVIGTCFLLLLLLLLLLLPLLPLPSLLKPILLFVGAFFVNGHSLHVKTNSRGCKSS